MISFSSVPVNAHTQAAVLEALRVDGRLTKTEMIHHPKTSASGRGAIYRAMEALEKRKLIADEAGFYRATQDRPRDLFGMPDNIGRMRKVGRPVKHGSKRSLKPAEFKDLPVPTVPEGMVGKMWYLASPYTLAPSTDEAMRWASLTAYQMQRAGLIVYSPVAENGNYVRCAGGADVFTHEQWIQRDFEILKRADGLVVAMFPRWSESKGIGLEIRRAAALGQPVFYLAVSGYTPVGETADGRPAIKVQID